MATPNTEVYLCKNTRLVPGSEDTYWFTSEAARQSFFISKSAAGLHLTALSYQRETRTMRVDLPLETCEACDYLMFKNTGYSSKWYYAFITQCTYINDEVTDIAFQIDPVQTWLPSLTVGTSFIERETTATDNFGEHILDEGFGAGELYPYSKVDMTGGSCYLVFAVTRLFYPASTPGDPTTVGILGNNKIEASLQPGADTSFYGSAYTFGYTIEPAFDWQQYGYGTCPYFYVGFETTDYNKINAFLDMYTSGKCEGPEQTPVLTPDHLVGAFLALRPAFRWKDNAVNKPTAGAPFIAGGKNLLSPGSGYNPESFGLDSATINPGTSGMTPAATFTANTTPTAAMFDGYTPRNKKCLQSPFVQVTFDDRNGGSPGMLKPELFGNPSEYPGTLANTIYLSQYALLNGARCERAIVISHYNKGPLYTMILDLPALPSFAFNASNYAIWQNTQGQFIKDQQDLNMQRSYVSAFIGIAGNVIRGDALGATANVINDGTSILFQSQQNELNMRQASASNTSQPPQSKGAIAGSNVMAMQAANGSMWPVLIGYCSHVEAVRAADCYFEQYGYKVLRRGTPTFTARSRFYFCKGNIYLTGGNVPTAARRDLESLFARGLRFWHGDYLGDYSTANSV